jgi:Glycine zipper 2TM domain
MSASIHPNQPNNLNPSGAPGAASKPLWALVGFLGAAVLAMGAALVYVQSHQSGRVPVSAPSATTPAAPALSAQSGPAAASTGAIIQDEVGKPVTPPVKKAVPAAKAVAPTHDKAAQGPVPVTTPGGSAGGAPAVVAAAPPLVSKPICGNCGTVEAATPVQREHSGIGVGAVAGGVIGGVLGNQIGSGGGKTAATVLGALGGGWAGNEVEKRMKKVTVYDVRVRMEDGNTRNFELASPVGAGAKVTVEGNALRLTDGSLAAPLPPPPQAQATKPGPNQSAY